MEKTYEVIKAQEKIWIYENANFIKKLWLRYKLKKPKHNEYKLIKYYPMSEEFYKIFPHNKY